MVEEPTIGRLPSAVNRYSHHIELVSEVRIELLLK